MEDIGELLSRRKWPWADQIEMKLPNFMSKRRKIMGPKKQDKLLYTPRVIFENEK